MRTHVCVAGALWPGTDDKITNRAMDFTIHNDGKGRPLQTQVDPWPPAIHSDRDSQGRKSPSHRNTTVEVGTMNGRYKNGPLDEPTTSHSHDAN